jgi:hypothetical protein
MVTGRSLAGLRHAALLRRTGEERAFYAFTLWRAKKARPRKTPTRPSVSVGTIWPLDLYEKLFYSTAATGDYKYPVGCAEQRHYRALLNFRRRNLWRYAAVYLGAQSGAGYRTLHLFCLLARDWKARASMALRRARRLHTHVQHSGGELGPPPGFWDQIPAE